MKQKKLSKILKIKDYSTRISELMNYIISFMPYQNQQIKNTKDLYNLQDYFKVIMILEREKAIDRVNDDFIHKLVQVNENFGGDGRFNYDVFVTEVACVISNNYFKINDILLNLSCETLFEIFTNKESNSYHFDNEEDLMHHINHQKKYINKEEDLQLIQQYLLENSNEYIKVDLKNKTLILDYPESYVNIYFPNYVDVKEYFKSKNELDNIFDFCKLGEDRLELCHDEDEMIELFDEYGIDYNENELTSDSNCYNLGEQILNDNYDFDDNYDAIDVEKLTDFLLKNADIKVDTNEYKKSYNLICSLKNDYYDDVYTFEIHNLKVVAEFNKEKEKRKGNDEYEL